MTLSLVAHCWHSGQFGVAIASSSPAVGARCSHVRAGVGAAVSQNITDPVLGFELLDALESLPAEAAMKRIVTDRQDIAYRQLMAIDRFGASAVFTGSSALGTCGVRQGENCAAGGNLLSNEAVLDRMIHTFVGTEGDLGDRLLIALEAGVDAGGEQGPLHSAGLKIADRLSWPYVDLRVDWSNSPVAELRTAWEQYRPQADAYVQRARDPSKAPGFGVPGDQ